MVSLGVAFPNGCWTWLWGMASLCKPLLQCWINKYVLLWMLTFIGIMSLKTKAEGCSPTYPGGKRFCVHCRMTPMKRHVRLKGLPQRSLATFKSTSVSLLVAVNH